MQSLGPSAWVISLTPFACGTGLELLQIADGNIVRENASSDHAIYRLANNISTAKVSRVHSATPPIGGTFVISFQGQLVKGIVIHLNSAARLISRSRKADHITPLLFDLHWLPVEQRINFKILLFTYKIVNGLAPSYLSDLLVPYAPIRALRSGEKLLFCQPSYRLKTYGFRAFSVCAPNLWNKLPMDIKCSPSVVTFKRKLKTHLFRLVYY